MGIRMLIRNGRVLDPTGAGWREDVSVLVDSGRILSIGPSADPTGPHDDIDVFDAEGTWIVPGLIDCHDHLFNRGIQQIEPGIPIDIQRSRIFEASDSLLAITAMAHAQTVLTQGVTTVRDLGSRAGIALAVRDAVASGTAAGPRVLAAGQAITMTGGHFARHSLEADGADGVRAGVRRQLAAGADCIKLMASGGLTGFPKEKPGHVEFGVEELAAGVGAAHAAERRVAAHAQAPEAIANAIAAGVDSIEHGFLMDPNQALQLSERQIAFTPTLNTLVNTISGMRIAGDGDLAEILEREILPKHTAAFKAAAEAGVLIGAATDSTGLLVQELELMVELGMSAAEALRTATLNAAMICGVHSDRGVIAEGLAADLLVLTADPLREISALRRVGAVMVGGALVERGGSQEIG